MDSPGLYYDHHYRQGVHLPNSWFEAPRRPPLTTEIKWRIHGFPAYGFDQWKRLWHEPEPDGLGRQRGWRQLTKAVKNGYAGFRLRKRGKEYWMSTRQLKPLLIKID